MNSDFSALGDLNVCAFHGNLLMSLTIHVVVLAAGMNLVPVNKVKPADVLQKQWTALPHDLLLSIRFQTTGQPKTRASCLPSLEQMEQYVPPHNARSVGPSFTFFLPLPSKQKLFLCYFSEVISLCVISLKAHWGWTQILLWFHAVS